MTLPSQHHCRAVARERRATAEARAVHSAGGAFVRTPLATGRRFPDVVSGLARLGSDEADGRLKPATWLVITPDGTVGDWSEIAAKAPRKPTRKPTGKPTRKSRR